MKKDILYIIIPAYNEEENIESVINDWYPIIERYNGNNGLSRLVIIDDGSTDNTFAYIKRYAEEKRQIVALHKENSGHGATLLYGYHYALEHNADYIFQTDSDGQTIPEEFHQFWNLREDYALVIGYRKKREDGFLRVIVTKVLKIVLLLCFRVSIVDANTPYRLMQGETLRQCIDMIPNDFNLSNVLLTVIYEKRKYTIKYVPITFKARRGGVNFINLKRIFFIGKKAIIDFVNINKSL